MKRRTALAVVALALALGAFLFTPIVLKSPGSVECVPQPTYASLSYAALGGYGVLYWPTTGWVDFPPFIFHNVSCGGGVQ
ncbi:MAG TPA: hypothetical protein VGS11_10560 [Candidatus Bathyarchaeia archaeon]|nr:hypothetical protein [Candidatus Bathyarchaeia archaeon]